MGSDKEFWVEIFKTGKHTDSSGKQDEYSPEFLQAVVDSFNELGQPVGFRDDTHSERGAGKISGGVAGLKVVGKKLLAKFTGMTADMLKKIEDRAYEFVSSGFKMNMKIGDKVWPVVLDHVAILNKAAPAVKGLAPTHAYFTATDGHGDEAIQIHTFSKAYLRGDAEHGDDKENEKQFNNDPRKEGNRMSEKALELLQKQVADLAARVEKADEEKRQFTDERDKEKKRADEAEKKLSEFTANATKEKREASMSDVKEFCEAQVKAGKMTPAGRDALLKDIGSTEANFTAEGNLVIPWENVKAFTEAGVKKLDTKERSGSGDRETEKTAGEQLVEKTLAFMQASPGTEYNVAFTAVKAANPDLTDEYIKETGGDQ